jgi:2-C-methyl-D-erythritol 2,4-cyclodiphosphate synthase
MRWAFRLYFGGLFEYNPHASKNLFVDIGDFVTNGMRIGIGYDTHRLEPGGPLRLGGIDIPHDRQTIGHSDADVLLHAVTDALLGAAALGDIGQMFPDTDPMNRGRDSAEMLQAALDDVRAVGLKICNVDCIVFAQRPKILPHKQAIRERLAEILEVEPERVGLQAKTGQLVGPVGREEAVEAQCVVLLEHVAEE